MFVNLVLLVFLCGGNSRLTLAPNITGQTNTLDTRVCSELTVFLDSLHESPNNRRSCIRKTLRLCT